MDNNIGPFEYMPVGYNPSSIIFEDINDLKIYMLHNGILGRIVVDKIEYSTYEYEVKRVFRNPISPTYLQSSTLLGYIKCIKRDKKYDFPIIYEEDFDSIESLCEEIIKLKFDDVSVPLLVFNQYATSDIFKKIIFNHSPYAIRSVLRPSHEFNTFMDFLDDVIKYEKNIIIVKNRKDE